MAPADPCLLGSTPLWSPFPQRIMAKLCSWEDTMEATAGFPSLGCNRRHSNFCLAHSQLACHESTQAAPGEGHLQRNCNAQARASTCSLTVWAHLLASGFSSPRTAFGWLQPWPTALTATSEETKEPQPPSEATPTFLTHRDCEINVYYFKPLSFGC